MIPIHEVNALGRVPREALRTRKLHEFRVRIFECDIPSVNVCLVPKLALGGFVARVIQYPRLGDRSLKAG